MPLEKRQISWNLCRGKFRKLLILPIPFFFVNRLSADSFGLPEGGPSSKKIRSSGQALCGTDSQVRC
jgi:hypothetical protein